MNSVRRQFICFALLMFLLLSGATAGTLNAKIELGGIGHDMVFDPARNRIYVTIPSLNEVVYVSTETYEVTDRVVVGSQPRGIDISHDGTRLFVALSGVGAVAVVDIATQAVSEIVVGQELGHSSTWDVIEAQNNRLFVTANPGSSGFAYVVQVLLDQGNRVNRVASNRIIRAAPVFAVSPDERFIYVGEGFSPNSLYKLDLSDAVAPIILEDDHGSVSGTNHLTVSPDGTRIHTTTGQVLRTGSFVQAGIVDRGIVSYGEAENVFYLAKFQDINGSSQTTTITSYDRNAFVAVNNWTLQCPTENYKQISELLVLPGDAGFLVLNQDTICGLVSGSGGLDSDEDGVIDSSDNCPMVANPLQSDTDQDGNGDDCDPYPYDADNLGACLGEQEFNADRISILEAEAERLQDLNDAAAARLSALEAEVARLQSMLDSDSDGVPDVDDLCPGTRHNMKIDVSGCSKQQHRKL